MTRDCGGGNGRRNDRHGRPARIRPMIVNRPLCLPCFGKKTGVTIAVAGLHLLQLDAVRVVSVRRRCQECGRLRDTFAVPQYEH